MPVPSSAALVLLLASPSLDRPAPSSDRERNQISSFPLHPHPADVNRYYRSACIRDTNRYGKHDSYNCGVFIFVKKKRRRPLQK